MGIYTKKELSEMWKRPVETQYDVAVAKILEAIRDTGGGISISFSGGKDSSLLLDMYCDIVTKTEYKDSPIQVIFANTTNETSAMLHFVKFFIPWCENRYGVKIDFREIRPKNGIVWAKYVLENGIPLISKQQSKVIRDVKNDMSKTGCDYETVVRLAKPELKYVKELRDIGFSSTGILALTGWRTRAQAFGKMFRISKRWLPMLNCKVDLNDRCCNVIKESALMSLHRESMMTGEQAAESSGRESKYLQYGCNFKAPSGIYMSRPFGPMTTDGILYALKRRGTPICPDYGEIVFEDGHYRCTKAQRTGCALCGFGCQYDTERFLRLQDTEPAKIAFAFKPKSEGGAGYKEAIEYMNEYCGTKVRIPEVHKA